MVVDVGWLAPLSYVPSEAAWLVRALVGVLAAVLLVRARSVEREHGVRMALLVVGAVSVAALLAEPTTPEAAPSAATARGLISGDVLGLLGACGVGAGLLLLVELVSSSIAVGVGASLVLTQLLAALVSSDLVPPSAGWSGLVLLLAVLVAVGLESFQSVALSLLAAGPLAWAVGLGDNPAVIGIVFAIGVVLHEVPRRLRREQTKAYHVGPGGP